MKNKPFDYVIAGIAGIITVFLGLLFAYFSMVLLCALWAFIMQFLFPVFMEIVAIQWPLWLITHSDKFSSWFVFFLIIKIFTIVLLPESGKIRAEIKKENKE